MLSRRAESCSWQHDRWIRVFIRRVEYNVNLKMVAGNKFCRRCTCMYRDEIFTWKNFVQWTLYVENNYIQQLHLQYCHTAHSSYSVAYSCCADSRSQWNIPFLQAYLPTASLIFTSKWPQAAPLIWHLCVRNLLHLFVHCDGLYWDCCREWSFGVW